MKLKAILHECAEGLHGKCPVAVDPQRFSGCDCHCHPRGVDVINTEKGALIEVTGIDGPGLVQIFLNEKPAGGFFSVGKARLYVLYETKP